MTMLCYDGSICDGPKCPFSDACNDYEAERDIIVIMDDDTFGGA